MTRPIFAHPIFEQLYARDYFIDDAVLREILALGPETAVPELLKIANSTLDTFLVDELPDEEWSSTYYFLHALYLLNELHAAEALDVYRRVLRLDSDSTEYWFGDMLFEELPTMLAHAGQTRLPELLALLEDPAIILQHRLVAAEALSRLALQQPELLPAIGAFMQRHLRHIIANADQAAQLFPTDEDAFDYALEDYLGGLLADLQEMGLRELEPEMRQLHRLGLVDGGMAGGEDDIDFDLARPRPPSPDIFTLYQQFRDVADNYSPFHPDAAGISQRRAAEEARLAQLRRDYALQQLERTQPPQPRQVSSKIGRNDSCPCGSGKKYKKCHGA